MSEASETVERAADPATLAAERERVRRALRNVEASVGSAFPGRANVVAVKVLALCAGHHNFDLSAPGLGKTAIIDAVLRNLRDVRVFATQAHGQSDVQDFVGPLSIAALRERDERTYATTGFLPWCDVAHVEELNEAPEGTLNAMLGIFNERRFQNAKIPLRTVFAASNRPWPVESTGALADRFLFRCHLEPEQTDDDFLSMLRSRADGFIYAPVEAVTLADLDVAKGGCAAVSISDEVLKALLDVRKTLATAGVEASPRRYVQVLQALQTEAYLAGDDVVDTDHFGVLRYVLWNVVEDIPRVESVLKNFQNGLYVRCVETLDDALNAFTSREADYFRRSDAVKLLNGRLTDAARTVQGLVGAKAEDRTKAQRRAADRVRPKMVELRTALQTVTREAANLLAPPNLDGWK